MDLEKLEQDTQSLIEEGDKAEFIYGLLRAYGLPKSSITRLKKGDLNKSKDDAQIVWRKKLCFRHEADGELLSVIDDLQRDTSVTRHRPRFIIVTNFEQFLAVDTLANDTLDIPFAELPKQCDFFLPWAGMEKATFRSESPVDIKAAETMGKLYELILLKNPPADDEARHALNVFFVRLLFCFFAEDTGIFPDDLFTKSIAQHTKDDGSNLQAYLGRLFRALDTQDKSDFPRYLQEFPYVGGTLFADDYPVPAFNDQARGIIVECGSLDWKSINPDIFGSMMQAVTHADTRGSAGMHYTSVVNIMKVIEPLFLHDLQEELANAEGNEKKLTKLLDRIYKLKMFDPACGSGNFLIIAFKELCRLEIDIFQELQELDPAKWGLARSGIQLTQFYGIEIEDFAHETAKLSLWLAEHQMNLEFEKVFGEARPTLPLRETGTVLYDNAARLDWKEFCPGGSAGENFILGNPPYIGSRNQNAEQKEDMRHVFAEGYKSIDYVSCWLAKAADYLKSLGGECAFVTTNSVCQGEQVGLIWPRVLGEQLEIGFAYQSFPWTNNARGRAGVTVIIVGIRPFSKRPKYIFREDRKTTAKNVSPYLADTETIYVHSRNKPLLELPKMNFGNMPADGGEFIFSTEAKESFLAEAPAAESFFRRMIGAKEYLNGQEKWCLWLEGISAETIESIPSVKGVVARVKALREKSSRPQLADIPHLFAQITQPEGKDFMLVPRVSSERRHYIPFGHFDKQNIAGDSCSIVCDLSLHYIAVLQSRMHMVWVRAVAGRLETRYRYSEKLCYNTFPFPDVEEPQIAALEDCLFAVLEQRERFSEKTLAELYDPDKMPGELLAAHRALDEAVERCYRSKPFRDDDERLEELFKRYQLLVSKSEVQAA